jgi:acyl-CoA thioesterase
MFEFDVDRSVTAEGPGVYRGKITERWNIGPVPNGGYLLAVAMAALEQELAGLSPLSVTCHYLRRAQPGPCRVEVERVKQGRTYATAVARLLQNDNEHLRVLATFGPLDRGGAPEWIDGAPPAIPEGGAGMRELGLPLPTIAQRFEVQVSPETLQWARARAEMPGAAAAKITSAEIRARVRFADGRPADLSSLCLFADALPPPVLAVMPLAWVPTLELTVHHRAQPAPGWLTCVFRTRFLFGGYLEEDGEIWDEAGKLVALSRQLAMAPASR